MKHGVEHYIPTRGPPTHTKAHCLAPDKLRIAKEEFRKMEDMGIVRKLSSPWSSHLHMVSDLQLAGDLVGITVASMMPQHLIDILYHPFRIFQLTCPIARFFQK